MNIPKDCDNAPKRRIIRDFIVARFQKEFKNVENKLNDAFEFRIIGRKTIESKKALENYLNNFANVTELTIDEMLSHGKFGACNGIFKTQNEEIHFAYSFEFKSAGKNVIKIITEYKIPSQ